MRKIKILVLLLALTLITVSLVACGEEEKKAAPAPKEPTKLSEDMKIVVVEGGESLLPTLPDGYKVNTVETKEDLKKAILGGDQDMAVVSPSTAAELYAESGGAILTVSPVKLGGVSILYFGMEREDMKPSDLSGRKIFTAEEGEPSQYILDQAIRDDGGYSVAYENLDAQGEVADALKNYNTYALVTEPYATQIMEEDSNVKKILDVDTFWTAKGHEAPPTWVLVTGKWKDEKNQDDVKVFIKDFEAAMEKEEDQKRVFYGQSDRGDAMIRNFFEEIIEGNKEAFGGKMPPDAMFYNIKLPN